MKLWTTDVCVSILKSSRYPSNSQKKQFGGRWVAVVQSEVICSKGKQCEHEGRGMHITSTHPHPHGVCFFRHVTLLLRCSSSRYTAHLFVEGKLLICFFLSAFKNNASFIVDVEVNLGWQSGHDSRLVFRSLRVQVSFWGCSRSIPGQMRC